MKSLRAASVLANACSCSNAARRPFSALSRRAAATNFTMPALSPTMTEGNIASWRVKEGDSFSAGDVLLEIETDKATMDVEAQDDGILMKIIAPDESKAVQVGARIAVMAEAGDDISSLELPADESPKQASKPKEEPKQETKQESEQESKSERRPPPQKTSKEQEKPSDTSPQARGTKQNYPLYPSVAQLLHENGLPNSAADEIPASGPKGRLLKGDVLAYLGKIDKKYPSEAAARQLKLSHLDLSNIQLAERVPPPAQAPAIEEEEVPQDVDLALPISLTAVLQTQKRVEEMLQTTVPLSVFIARASELANEDLPLPKGRISSDELFNAVLGLPRGKNTSRGHFVPQLSTISLSSRSRPPQPDIIDLLSGKKARRTKPAPPTSEDLFSVTAKPGEEQRAMLYLERLKSVLEEDPGRLVL